MTGRGRLREARGIAGRAAVVLAVGVLAGGAAPALAGPAVPDLAPGAAAGRATLLPVTVPSPASAPRTDVPEEARRELTATSPVPARGLPLERLPTGSVGEPSTGAPAPGSTRTPLVPPSAGWLVLGGGALLVLVLRQRRLAAAEERASGGTAVATGVPALVSALSEALSDSWDSGEPVGLVLLRVEAPRGGRPVVGAEPTATSADAVLATLDAAVPLLAEQAGRSTRSGDRLVRLGVNRLAVVLPGSGETETSLAADRLRSALTAVAPREVVAAVGSASSPANGTAPGVLLRAAEQSLSAPLVPL